MKDVVHKLRKKWIWGLGATFLFVALFFGLFSGKIMNHIKAADETPYQILYGASGEIQTADTGSYTLGSRDDTLTFMGSDFTNKAIKWTISGNQDKSGSPIVEVAGKSDAVIEVNDSRSINIRAKAIGKITVNARIEKTGADAGIEVKNFVITVRVGLTINRGMKPGTDGIAMHNLYDATGDKKPYSIIMNEGTEWELGEGTETTGFNQKLNLVMGNARTDVTWTTGNENVAVVDPATNKLKAIGGGRTVLTAVPKTGDSDNDTSPDTIDVYVNPKVEINGNQFLSDKKADGTVADPVTIDNKTEIKLPNLKFLQNDSNDTIGNRVRWKAERRTSDNNNPWELLCDSTGYKKQGAEVLEMEWIDAKNAYSFKGKGGRYKLSFYPGNAYDGEGENAKASVTACTSVIVDVNSTYYSHTIRLNVNGRYDLSNGLNIPKDVLQGEFDIKAVSFTPDNGASATPDPGGAPAQTAKPVESREYITLGTGADKGIITAKKIGEARVEIVSNNKTIIPGISQGNKIVVTIIIGESFSLTATKMTMAVGQEENIYGVLSTGAFPEGSKFVWSTQNNRDNQYLELVGDTDSDGVTILAKTETPGRGGEVTIVLEWTNPSGVTQIATCEVTITNSTRPVTLDKTELQMQSDDTGGETLTVTNFIKDGTDLMWVSSDSEIVIAQQDPDYENMAKVIPQGKTGIAYITVVNKNNNQTAVCKVIVNQYMTELKIDKGEKFSVKLSEGQLLMKATYNPQNATSTAVSWTSSSTDVAEVEANGMDCIVKLKKAGTTVIRVASTEQPAAYSIYAECILTVETIPLSGITLKEKTLTMVAGDTYTVVPTLTPENAANKTLSWETGNSNVAKVDDKGVITAVAVGQTTITVSGGEAKPQSIIVNVLNKLNTIRFEENNVQVEQGKTHPLKVIFNPDADVNTKLSFVSTDTSVATVDDKGEVTGVSEGMAMVIATAEELGTTGAITCMIEVIPPIIEAESFDIDPKEMTLVVGDEKEIIPVYTPEDTTSKEVIYTSGNEEIASVSEEGIVTGLKPGFTVITCEDVATQKTAICQVTVENDASLRLSPTSRELVKGESFTIKKIVAPSKSDSKAKWVTSNSSVASVNSSGKVTGKKLGTATITCTLTKYDISATCTVKVANKRTTLKLDKNGIRINIGQTYKLKKTVWTNSNKKPSVTFTSKNKKIATVGKSSGSIKGKKVGSTVITAKTSDKKATAKCRVTVIRRVTGIKLNKTYGVAYVGRTLKLSATVKPKNASIKKLKWTSSNTGVATVLSNGTVTGLSEGDTYITAKTTDGSNRVARCFVKVLEPVAVSSIVVAQTDLTMKKGDSTKLSYTVLPDNHSDDITFASDNNRVAKVSKAGTVKAVGTGNANITITSTSGVVSNVAVNVVALNKSSIRMRQYDTETLTVMGTSANITWYSANNRIATVTNGRVMGRGTGTTYVYAFVNGCRMGCKITVVSVNNKKR